MELSGGDIIAKRANFGVFTVKVRVSSNNGAFKDTNFFTITVNCKDYVFNSIPGPFESDVPLTTAPWF